MDARIEAVIDAYEARHAEELRNYGQGMDRDQMLLPVGRDGGLLINLLIKTHGCKNILEIGTSYGSTAIWLGEAARATGGKVTTLELADYKAAYARDKLAEAGLDDVVEVVVGDALDSLAKLEGPFDFILIDLWKELYVPCFDALYPSKLTDGALILADNMIRPPVFAEDAKVYRRHVRAKPDIQSLLLDVGEGIELSRKQAAL